MSNFKKVGNLKLETSAYEQKLNNTDIVFYNNDINTSVLMFQINKDNKPLLISDNNVHVDLCLVANDGSWIIDDAIEFEDPLNGRISYQIPNWFLSHHGKVRGQAYIGINGVDDTVTEVEFTFNIKDDLINNVPVKEKIVQYRTFIELKNRILERVQEIEDGIANGSDYVSEMKRTVLEGKEEITQIANNSNESITEKTSQFMSELTSQFDTTKNDVEQIKNNAIFTVNAKSEETLQNMQNISDITESKYNDMLSDFQELIDDDSFVKAETLGNYAEKIELSNYAKKVELENYINNDNIVSILTEMGIQQSTLTNNDGTAKFINLSGIIENLKALNSGLYYLTNVPNLPTTVTSTAGFMIVLKRNQDYTKFIYSPHNSNQLLVSHKNKNNTLEWTSIGVLSDSGWIPFNLMNGANTNTSYMGQSGIECSYRVIDHGNRKEKIVRINGNNITSNQQIAQLPVGFALNTQIHVIRTAQRSDGGFIRVSPDGKVHFFKQGSYEWYTDDDVYGQISWTE